MNSNRVCVRKAVVASLKSVLKPEAVYVVGILSVRLQGCREESGFLCPERHFEGS